MWPVTLFFFVPVVLSAIDVGTEIHPPEADDEVKKAREQVELDEQRLGRDKELLGRARKVVWERRQRLEEDKELLQRLEKEKDKELLSTTERRLPLDNGMHRGSVPGKKGKKSEATKLFNGAYEEPVHKVKVEAPRVGTLSHTQVNISKEYFRRKEVLRCLKGETPDQAMKPVIASFKKMIAKLEELNKYDGSEDLMAWCQSRESDYEAAEKPFQEPAPDDAPVMVKLFIKTNKWALHLAKEEIDWLCSGSARQVMGSGRLQSMKEAYSTYVKSLQCQPGDVLCVGGSLTGQRPLCNCTCAPGWTHGDKEGCEVCTDLEWKVGSWGPCEDGEQKRELQGCECRRRDGLKFDVDFCKKHSEEAPPVPVQACESPAPQLEVAAAPSAAPTAGPAAAEGPPVASSASAPSASALYVAPRPPGPASPPAPAVSSLGQKDRTKRREKPRIVPASPPARAMSSQGQKDREKRINTTSKHPTSHKPQQPEQPYHLPQQHPQHHPHHQPHHKQRMLNRRKLF